jgi:molybdenum cofactor cytidylyltransferase
MGCILKGGGGLYSRVVVGAVLLAAGSGSRIGHRPKCLLELGGVPLIRRLLIALSGAGVDELVVVTGHHAGLVEPVVQHFPVTLVRNPDPDAGQVSSQRIGLAALTGRLDAVIVALADQPLLNAQDITALIGAWKKRTEGVQVVYPEVETGGGPGPTRSRGNPVIFSAEVREQILAGAADLGCRQWQAAHPAQVAPFVTDNRRYKVDIDTPEDLARFERETGHALRWPAGVTA